MRRIGFILCSLAFPSMAAGGDFVEIGPRDATVPGIGEPATRGDTRRVRTEASTIAGLDDPRPPADDERKAQVAAAVAAAQDAIYDDVLRTVIIDGITVDTLVRKTDSQDRLRAAVRRARQIGGPRWPEPQTCQVQLELSGAEVAAELVEIARGAGRPPIDAESVRRHTAEWEKRVFSAVGSSAVGQGLEGVRPDPAQKAWANVADEIRRRAIRDARRSAASAYVRALAAVEVDGQTPLAALLRDEAFVNRVGAWIESRPVTRVDFRDDLRVELTLHVPGDEWGNQVAAAARAAGVEAAGLAGRVAASVPRAVGVATVTTAPGAPVVQGVRVPATPPAWAGKLMDQDGKAPSRGADLRAAGVATDDAIARLRERVLALPLDGKITLGQAADESPAIRRAVERGLRTARPFKTDYHGDHVVVSVSIDLGAVWKELALIE